MYPSSVVSKPSVGLGGTSTAGFSSTITTGTGSSVPATSVGQGQVDGNKGGGGLKDTTIPKELIADIEIFKRFVKEEKSVSSEIAHVSPKTHQKVMDEIKALNCVVKQLSSGVSKQKLQIEKLKKDAAQEMQNVEIAQRTKDTPPALQYENVAPYVYFNRLITDFENQMIRYARQIEETEQHLMTSGTGLCGGGTDSLAPDDLAKAMQKIHGAFISLAGKYQPIHDAVKQQKAVYLQNYRQKHGTVDDPFEANRKNRNKDKQSGKPHSRLGPSPFTGRPDPIAQARASLNAGQNQGQRPGAPTGPPTLGLGTANNAFGMPATVPAGSTNPFGGGGGSFGFGTQQNSTAIGGLGTTPFGTPAASSTSIFGNTGGAARPNLTLGFGQTAVSTAPTFGAPQATSFGAAAAPTSNFSFGSTGTGVAATPGLFGSTLSPFGQQQTLGKRGKH